LFESGADFGTLLDRELGWLAIQQNQLSPRNSHRRRLSQESGKEVKNRWPFSSRIGRLLFFLPPMPAVIETAMSRDQLCRADTRKNAKADRGGPKIEKNGRKRTARA